MKKVLIVNTVPFEINGISTVIMNYYRSMNNNEIIIDFVATKSIYKNFKNEIKARGNQVFLLDNKKKRPIKYIKQLRSIISENKYDVIHVHGNSALMEIEMFLAKRYKIPTRIAHSHNTTCTFKILHKILYPFFIKSCTHRLACGIDAGKWLYKNNDFIVLNNGIDIDKYKYNSDIRDDYRKKLNIKEEKLIGHVGNFVYQKNHEYLIDVFAELLKINYESKLVLVGDGQLRGDITKKIFNLGIEDKVIILGKVDNVQKYIQAMDVFVLPSRFEGLPLALIEAQASGLPCFISDNITKEVNISGLVEFISLEKEFLEWGKIIDDYDYSAIEREKAYLAVIAAGYDIKNNSKIIYDLYTR